MTINSADIVYISIASLWEIAIKLKLGKLLLQGSYKTIVSAIDSSDILILRISFADTVKVRLILNKNLILEVTQRANLSGMVDALVFRILI